MQTDRIDTARKNAQIPIIFDNHVHLSRTGRNIEEIKRFEKAGGTHLMLVTLPRVKGQTAEEQYKSTVDMARKVIKETTVKAYVCIGPHPVEIIHMYRGGMTLGSAKNEMLKSIEVAIGMIENGQAHSLGEVGRPHFHVSPDIMQVSNEILEYALRRAKDIGCAVQLHTETGTPAVCSELAAIADRAGYPKERLVKHYSAPVVRIEDNAGIFPSVLAGKDAVKQSFSQGNRFMLETDFLDDVTRPGAVLDITTVPKRARWAIETGLADEESLMKVLRDNPSRIYGISMES